MKKAPFVGLFSLVPELVARTLLKAFTLTNKSALHKTKLFISRAA